MEQDPNQSRHEIGHARQLLFSPVRAEVVTIRSSSSEGGSQEEGGREKTVPHQRRCEEIEGLPMRNTGPRIRFIPDQASGPRILFRPEWGEPNQGVSESPNHPDGTSSPIHNTTLSQKSDTDSTLARMGSWIGTGRGNEYPSYLGPFFLESLLTGSSDAEGMVAASSRATSIWQRELRGLKQDNNPNRTVTWLANTSPEATTAPSHTPPLPTRASKTSNSVNRTKMVNRPDSDPTRPHQERSQAPGDSAIRGNFIPLSTSFKQRSPSPQREQGPHGVYLQLSLTDSQMDRLTAVLSTEDNEESFESFSRGREKHAGHNTGQLKKTDKENTAPSMRSRSPAKTYQSNTTPSRARSRSPIKFSSIARTSEDRRAAQGFEFDTTAQSSSKTQEVRFTQNSPATQGTPTRTTGRTARGPPTPIDTDIARAHAKMNAQRGGRQPTVVVQCPPERERSPVRQSADYLMVDDSSSYYSQDSKGHRYPSCISPLRIQKENDPKHVSVLQGYIDQQISGTESEQEQPRTVDEVSSGAELQYTPLAPFLPKGIPSARKASKTLIGENGWLENTSKPAEPTTSPTRGGGFLGNLVKKAKEMMESNHDTKAQRKSRESDKSSRPPSRQLAISLTPREQSLLYCEFEFILASALTDYITTQFNSGRLEADKLRKVAEDWQRKGRPKVIGFRYDLETQLDLVRMHVNDFKFYSRVAATAGILGIIDTMKGNARVLRVKTFCQPDTVVAKQLLDAQGLFNILGCPEEQHIKLVEIIAFFKAAIERERLHALQGTVVPQAGSAEPLRRSKSQAQVQGQGTEWWGTTAVAAAAAS